MITTATPDFTDETPVFVPCPRCGGRGGFEVFGHIDNGRCFKCGGGRGHWSTKGAEAKRLHDAEQRYARKEAKRAKAEADFLAAHDGLAEALQIDHRITDDLAATLRDCGSLSDKQVALAHKIAADVAEREAERAAQPNEPVVEGRGPIVGTVLHVRAEDTMYGTSYKMLVADDRGFRLWGTIPRSILSDADKGSRVSMTATVTAKKDGFGFYSRPSKAVLLDD